MSRIICHSLRVSENEEKSNLMGRLKCPGFDIGEDHINKGYQETLDIIYETIFPSNSQSQVIMSLLHHNNLTDVNYHYCKQE